MVLPKFYNFVVGIVPTLPSKASFLQKHVVPATTDDRHYNDKCGVCWDKYSTEHPAAKLLPCGHVFGHTCIYQLVESPTGDLCPICRVKLFRRDFSNEIVILLVSAFAAYISFIADWIHSVQQMANNLLPDLLNQLLALGILGPQIWVTTLVHHCTDVESRNPHFRLSDTFEGTNLTSTLINGLKAAPIIWLMHYVFGSSIVKVVWFIDEILGSWAVQQDLWTHSINQQFDNSADCQMIKRLVRVTIVIKGIILATIFWARPSGIFLLASAWNVLANVAWR